MATLGAGIAGSYIGYAVQRAFLGEEESKAKLKATHTRAARRVADEMKSLRGAAMKLGQTLSLQTGTLPDETLAELATLQMNAPGMHPSLARAQIKQSLGAEPEEIFKKFEPEPFAAASLGQVHKAITREGVRVAVKVQYPGIRQAIKNDFKLFRAVSRPAQTTGHVSKSALEEVEQQILAETDYRREGRNIEFFGESLASLPFVKVPRFLPAYSSDKVLTMTLMRGRHLEVFLETRPSQRLRNALGEHLFELFYFQVLKLGSLHADPHWGNYLFTDDGRVALVDFGCAKDLAPESVDYLRSVFLYPGSVHSTEFRQLLEKRYKQAGMKLLPAARCALIRFADNFYRLVYPTGPEGDQPFDFGDKNFLQNYLTESTNIFRTKGLLTDLIFMGRAEMGLYQTLHRLRARVHTSRIVRKFL
jgi:predicted unusual protein kinase regulating ubiquinone biosynthesis (AarF/ABC1/UbiB family)